jgi:hypothetical protein
MKTRSRSDVRIDDRGWGRYLDIPSRVQETGSGTPDAKLHTVERDFNDRLVWVVSGLPDDYVTRLANDELPPVSPRAALVTLEMTLGMVAEHQRARRGARR